MQSVNGMIQLAAMVLQIMRGTLEERRVRGKEGMQVKSLAVNQGNPAWALGRVAQGGSGCYRGAAEICKVPQARCGPVPELRSTVLAVQAMLSWCCWT